MVVNHQVFNEDSIGIFPDAVFFFCQKVDECCIKCIILYSTVNTVERRGFMISIDNRSRIPIYEQLINGFKLQIMNGVLLPDEKLPSVRQLAQELTINPNTIQKAYRELEHLGYTYSVPGKGSFVNTIQNEMNKERINMLTETLHKTVQELLFLGLTKEEIIAAIENMRGEHDDNQTE